MHFFWKSCGKSALDLEFWEGFSLSCCSIYNAIQTPVSRTFNTTLSHITNFFLFAQILQQFFIYSSTAFCFILLGFCSSATASILQTKSICCAAPCSLRLVYPGRFEDHERTTRLARFEPSLEHHLHRVFVLFPLISLLISKKRVLYLWSLVEILRSPIHSMPHCQQLLIFDGVVATVKSSPNMDVKMEIECSLKCPQL